MLGQLLCLLVIFTKVVRIIEIDLFERASIKVEYGKKLEMNPVQAVDYLFSATYEGVVLHV